MVLIRTAVFTFLLDIILLTNRFRYKKPPYPDRSVAVLSSASVKITIALAGDIVAIKCFLTDSSKDYTTVKRTVLVSMDTSHPLPQPRVTDYGL